MTTALVVIAIVLLLFLKVNISWGVAKHKHIEPVVYKYFAKAPEKEVEVNREALLDFLE